MIESKSKIPEGAGANRPAAAQPQAALDDPLCRRCEVRHLAFCAALEPGQLGDLDAIVEHKRIAAGETPLMEGDEAAHVFNVVTGAAKLYKLLPDGRCQITGTSWGEGSSSTLTSQVTTRTFPSPSSPQRAWIQARCECELDTAVMRARG